MTLVQQMEVVIAEDIDLDVRCPVCNMKLPLKVTPGIVGRFKVLCVSKTCGKIWVVFDTR